MNLIELTLLPGNFNNTLFEGGNAIKGVSRISKEEVINSKSDLIKFIRNTLKITINKIKMIGSAGKKDTSGDIDIAVQCDSKCIEDHIQDLAGNNQYRIMNGIGVFSFAYSINDKLVQIDLMPVNNINFAEWSFQANQEDLEDGLKGAQRNELFFAVAKYMPIKILKSDSNNTPIDTQRYFYDLSKGLMTGVRTRISLNGKIGKSLRTIDKKVISDDPEKIVKLMFGDYVTPKDLSSFDGTLQAIKSSKFKYKDRVDDILKLTIDGIKNKKLKIPKSIKE